MALCSQCQNFDIQSFHRDPDGMRGYRLKAVQEQAERGCPFCRLLILNLGDSPGDLNHKRELWVHMKMYNSSADLDNLKEAEGFNKLKILRGPLLHSFGQKPDWNNAKGTAEFFVAADPGSAAALSQQVSGRYLGENSKSDEQISALKSWIDDCLGHRKCRQSFSGTAQINPRIATLPFRCIDMGSDTPVLKETDHETGSYVILSHRWTSQTAACQTTTRNYRARLKRLPLKRLPKTFRDSIWLAKQLGVRYLWIDSLCIIQEGDGMRDWNKEALRMASYYQQALVTIAAAGASEEYGLFPPIIRPTPYNIVKLPYRNSARERQGSFYIYQCDDDVTLDHANGILESELLQRGWVFQEWMLSRRIVSYTPFGVFFHCQTGYPRNDNQEIIGDSFSKTDGNELFLKQHFCLQAANTKVLGDLWYDIVEIYSNRDLTKPHEDRIVALCGVAREFREALVEREKKESLARRLESFAYASGIWIRDIHHGLLWETNTENHEDRRRVDGIPTWSWASRMVGVKWASRSDSVKYTIELVGLLDANGVLSSVVTSGDGGSVAGPPNLPLEGFDVDNMFTALLLCCQMQTVLIRGHFNTEDEIKEASRVTDHNPDFGRRNWRAICSPSSPGLISGWASIEDPDLEKQLLFYEGTAVQALHISTREGVDGGINLGLLRPIHNVYNVIFVKNIRGRRFERMGIGRLFGEEISARFRDVAEQVIELV